MRGRGRFFGLGLAIATASPTCAVEGPTAAGPIGGTDTRSALMPPPGIYAGTIQGVAQTIDFLGGDGQPIPALGDARLTKGVAGPFFYYVADTQVLGGSVGFGAILPTGVQCGRLFSGTASRCQAGIGDLYAEVNWGRFFGTVRPSADPGVNPIPEGLAVMAGFGVVFPTGQFRSSDILSQALSLGTNIWDLAPSLAVTYTTPAWVAEGTEFSAKVYWNNYLENSRTGYLTGELVNVDFAVTEHLGRFQAGLAGLYAVQVEDDRFRGVPIPPDGRRGETLQLGGVVSYDMPESASSVKIKALTSVFAVNTVSAWAVIGGWVRKF